MAVIKYNGTEITCPSVQEYEGQQLVDSGRNANGVVVAQKINRRQVKLTLEWKVIYPKELQKILQLVETFIVISDLIQTLIILLFLHLQE